MLWFSSFELVQTSNLHISKKGLLRFVYDQRPKLAKVTGATRPNGSDGSPGTSWNQLEPRSKVSKMTVAKREACTVLVHQQNASKISQTYHSFGAQYNHVYHSISFLGLVSCWVRRNFRMTRITDVKPKHSRNFSNIDWLTWSSFHLWIAPRCSLGIRRLSPGALTGTRSHFPPERKFSLMLCAVRSHVIPAPGHLKHCKTKPRGLTRAWANLRYSKHMQTSA